MRGTSKLVNVNPGPCTRCAANLIVAIKNLQYYLERHGVPHRLFVLCEDLIA